MENIKEKIKSSRNLRSINQSFLMFFFFCDVIERITLEEEEEEEES